VKQSEVNELCREAAECLSQHHWVLPPKPEWAACDFGLGDYTKVGLVEVLLANEPEYCEKIMYARAGMVTPAHTHYEKKEDIICRSGLLQVTVWANNPAEDPTSGTVELKVNRQMQTFKSGVPFELPAGSRMTLTPGIWHEFVPLGKPCLIGEVSTYCNEEIDNVFADKKVDIFQPPEADVPPALPV